MRVLHLIDLRDRSDESRQACAAALQIGEAKHRVIGLGSARDVAAAASEVGLRVNATFTPVAAWPEVSFRRLRALIGDRDGRDATRPWADVVQCWGASVAGLARLASGHRTPPRVVALLQPPTNPMEGVTLRRYTYGLAHAHCFSFCRHVRQTWAEPIIAGRGGRMLEQNIRLLDAPAWPNALVTVDERAAARARLGLVEQDMAITLLADPPEAGDLASFVFTLGLLFTTGVRVVGLARAGRDGAGPSARRAARFVRLHGRRWGISVVPDSTDALLAASDAALWLGADPSLGRGVASGPVLLHRCMARGVPLVAARDPISVEAIEQRATPDERFTVARDGSLAALADRLLRVVSRPAVEGVASRTAAGGDGFSRDLVSLWREVTNTPQIVPGLPTPLAMLEGAA